MTVSHSGRGWRLAPSLIAMEAEADRLAPHRSKVSDGSIGDAAHRARGSKSDHNPEGGWVTALDLTHDPRGGWDAHARARQLAARRDPRIDYIISNREIWDLGRGWRRYTGPNGHTQHAHFSIFNTATARGITDPFWPAAGTPPRPPGTPAPALEEDDMKTQLVQFSDKRVFHVSGCHRKYMRTGVDVLIKDGVPYYPWDPARWAAVEQATIEIP